MKSIRNRLNFVAISLVASMVLGGTTMGQVGTVVAWGKNDYGQCLGTGLNGSALTSTPLGDAVQINGITLTGVSAIAGGAYHTIALKNGEVLAWGWNQNGQCTIPLAAKAGVTAIAGGYAHTIALKNGEVLAWGRNDSGQCNVPALAQSGVTAIAGGSYNTIALKNGGVLAWGWDGNSGQCTVPPAAQSGVTAIAGAYDHRIALKNGEVLAWGSNAFGQRTIPATAQSGVTAIADGVGAIHTIALKNGEVLAWGAGTTNTHSYPEWGQCIIPTDAQSGVTAIAGIGGNTIALKSGAVLAWGSNDNGQCTIPAAAQSGVAAIAGGLQHTIALKSHETITGVLPISGPSSGNTNITITGTNFESPATVTIGGAPATNIVVVSDTQITATTPAGFPGPAVVTVNLGSSTAFYYRPSCGSDIDNNGVVDSADLGIVLLDFGNCSESLTTPQEQEPLILQAVELPTPVLNKK